MMMHMIWLLVVQAVVGLSKYDGEYIVRLSDTSQATHDALLRDTHPLSPAQMFHIGSDLRLALFRGVNTSAQLQQLQTSSAVQYVEANGEMHVLQGEQPNPPSWGLPRVAQRNLPLDNVYRYSPTAGKGVDVYILDTGILLTHNDFEGRATWGYTAPEHEGEGPTDLNGHGTHCAGTVAGRQYGVAKSANLIAVKVLGGGGSGSFAGIISGIEYATSQRQQFGRPSVISLSLGGGRSQTVNDAIDASARAGVHNALAAGNDNRADACTKSPASAPLGFTVAAGDRNDNFASFTNIGSCIDIWAPGVDIMSAYIGGNDASRSLSGTSMSTPHVAGVMALLLADEGDKPPADLGQRLQDLATEGIINFPTTTPQVKVPVTLTVNTTARRACETDADCGRTQQCCPGNAGSGRFCARNRDTCCGPTSCQRDCCSVNGQPNHCTTGRYEACCAGSQCRAFGTPDVCCNPGSSDPAHCCPFGSTCLPNGGCYNPLWEATPNLNLYSNPPAFMKN